MFAGKNICFQAAAFLDSLSIDMQHDHLLKKLIFDLVTTSSGTGAGGRGKGLLQNIRYHAPAFRDTLKIDMQHDHVLKKLNFDLLTPSPGLGVSACKIFAIMLLHFVIPFQLICNMTIF